MTINRTPEFLANLILYIEDAEQFVADGGTSIRRQWPIEGHDGRLTLFANEQGVFVQEPYSKPAPAREWVEASS